MNWVGGVRRRVLLREEERRRQEQFFATHASAKQRSSTARSDRISTTEETSASVRGRQLNVGLHPKIGCHSWRDKELVCERIQQRTTPSSNVCRGDFKISGRHSIPGCSSNETPSKQTNKASGAGYEPSSARSARSEYSRKFKIKPSSIHGPFSRFLLQLEVEGVQKRLELKQNERLRISELQKKDKERITKQNEEKDRHKDIQKAKKGHSKDKIRIEPEEDRERKVKVKNIYNKTDKTLRQTSTVDICSRNIGSSKFVSESVKEPNYTKREVKELSNEEHREPKDVNLSQKSKSCYSDKREQQKKRMKYGFDSKGYADSKAYGSEKVQKKRLSDDTKLLHSTETLDSSKRCNTEKYTVSKTEKNLSSDNKIEKDKRRNRECKEMLSRISNVSACKEVRNFKSSLLAGAPRIRTVLTLSPERHKGRIWVPLDLPELNSAPKGTINSRTSNECGTKECSESQTLQSKTTENKEKNCRQPLNTASVEVDKEKNIWEMNRLALLLGDQSVRAASKYLRQELNDCKADSSLTKSQFSESMEPLPEKVNANVGDRTIKRRKLEERHLEGIKTSNENALKLSHNLTDKYLMYDEPGSQSTLKLGERNLNFIGKGNSIALAMDKDNCQQTVLSRTKLSNFTRNVVEIESSCSFIMNAKDKTPYMERDLVMHQSLRTCNTSGGSSNRSSRTPSDSMLERSLEETFCNDSGNEMLNVSLSPVKDLAVTSEHCMTSDAASGENTSKGHTTGSKVMENCHISSVQSSCKVHSNAVPLYHIEPSQRICVECATDDEGIDNKDVLWVKERNSNEKDIANLLETSPVLSSREEVMPFIQEKGHVMTQEKSRAEIYTNVPPPHSLVYSTPCSAKTTLPCSDDENHGGTMKVMINTTCQEVNEMNLNSSEHNKTVTGNCKMRKEDCNIHQLHKGHEIISHMTSEGCPVNQQPCNTGGFHTTECNTGDQHRQFLHSGCSERSGICPSEKEICKPEISPSEEEICRPRFLPLEEEIHRPGIFPPKEELSRSRVYPPEEEINRPGICPPEEKISRLVISPPEEEISRPLKEESNSIKFDLSEFSIGNGENSHKSESSQATDPNKSLRPFVYSNTLEMPQPNTGLEVINLSTQRSPINLAHASYNGAPDVNGGSAVSLPAVKQSCSELTEENLTQDSFQKQQLNGTQNNMQCVHMTQAQLTYGLPHTATNLNTPLFGQVSSDPLVDPGTLLKCKATNECNKIWNTLPVEGSLVKNGDTSGGFINLFDYAKPAGIINSHKETDPGHSGGGFLKLSNYASTGGIINSHIQIKVNQAKGQQNLNTKDRELPKTNACLPNIIDVQHITRDKWIHDSVGKHRNRHAIIDNIDIQIFENTSASSPNPNIPSSTDSFQPDLGIKVHQGIKDYKDGHLEIHCETPMQKLTSFSSADLKVNSTAKSSVMAQEVHHSANCKDDKGSDDRKSSDSVNLKSLFQERNIMKQQNRKQDFLIQALIMRTGQEGNVVQDAAEEKSACSLLKLLASKEYLERLKAKPNRPSVDLNQAARQFKEVMGFNEDDQLSSEESSQASQDVVPPTSKKI